MSKVIAAAAGIVADVSDDVDVDVVGVVANVDVVDVDVVVVVVGGVEFVILLFLF